MSAVLTHKLNPYIICAPADPMDAPLTDLIDTSHPTLTNAPALAFFPAQSPDLHIFPKPYDECFFLYRNNVYTKNLLPPHPFSTDAAQTFQGFLYQTNHPHPIFENIFPSPIA